MKIVELLIDEDFEESGIEAISLVATPAHEENWIAFNGEEEPIQDNTITYKIVEDDFCSQNPLISTLGEPYNDLIEQGWVITRVEHMTPERILKMSRQKFNSNPNAESYEDTEQFRLRFKYVGVRDNKNRQFCADMLSMNRVYRMEDIEQLSNPEFGNYDIFTWRGSFNCRHTWVKLIYQPEGKIRNSGLSTLGLIDTESLNTRLQPDTRTTTTKESTTPQNQWEPGTQRTGPNMAVGYMSKEKMGLEDACWEGYEAIGTKILDGKEVPNCVPIKMTEDDFAEAITDYPQGVKDAAARVVKYTEENGWGTCGTQVGKVRASQLANGEPISVDTLKRMYSYLSRHKVDLQSSTSYEDGCGKLMYDSWGGEAGLTWAERKLKQLENEKMTFAVASEDKMIIVGAAMIPNKMIHRYDMFGNKYYVYFSKDSIRKMANRFLKQKRTDETSIEHNGLKLGSDKVYITESWISEDPAKDKSSIYGFDLPAGTWFVQMKVDDPKVWELVKENNLSGFSVEGLFKEKAVFSKQEGQINQIKQLLKSI
jgi:hypothetical protein